VSPWLNSIDPQWAGNQSRALSVELSQLSLHLVSGRSRPSVSSSDT
jgi:hypothetical protein